MGISRRIKRREEKLAKKQSLKNDLKLQTESNSEYSDLYLAKSLLINHNKDYIDNKISKYFLLLLTNDFLDITTLFFSAKHNRLGVNNLKDLTQTIKNEIYSWILTNTHLINIVESNRVQEIKFIVDTLNKTTNKKITITNVKDYLEELINKVPEIFRFINEYHLSFSSEKEIENVNEQFTKYKNIEYEKIVHYDKGDIEYFKNIYENLSFRFLENVNNFKRKYITSDNRILIDNFYDHPEEWWYNEGQQVTNDIVLFILSWYFAEEDSTTLKLLAYEPGYSVVYYLFYKEFGINLEDFVNKSESDLKHKIRSVLPPYGVLSSFLNNLKYTKADPDCLLKIGVELIENKFTYETFKDKLLEPEILSETIEKLKYSLSSLNKKPETLEEAIRDQINTIITKNINIVSNGFYDLNFYSIEDYDRIIAEINFENDVNRFVDTLKKQAQYGYYFAYPDFDNRLKSSMLEILENSKCRIEEKALEYKYKITENNAEEIMERIEKYLRNKINFIYMSKDFVTSFGADKATMVKLFGSDYKKISLMDKYQIIFDNAKEFLNKIEISNEDKKIIMDRINFLADHNKRYFKKDRDLF